MTYVWLDNGNGVLRFVNDIYLDPCNKCGERISTCRANDCLGEPEPEYCGACEHKPCACDNIYDAHKENLLD